ncbi:unnamed protein product [Pedinophyceae sp. YPF-701]|nr:unnamed protein product [Pedinophyceae sp. YPF-701]
MAGQDGSQPFALVVCGPSGVGKGTLINKLTEGHTDKFGFSVSHTTRAPRPGEQNGKHYWFAQKEAMQKEIDEGKFIEHAHVHDNIYGTSVAAVDTVLAAGKCCILDIDVQGARLVRKSDVRSMFVFVAPPSFEELEKRLRGRGTETEDKVQVRLRNAKTEMDAVDEPGLFDYVLVNDDLVEAAKGLEGIAMRAFMGAGPESVGGAVRWRT